MKFNMWCICPHSPNVYEIFTSTRGIRTSPILQIKHEYCPNCVKWVANCVLWNLYEFVGTNTTSILYTISEQLSPFSVMILFVNEFIFFIFRIRKSSIKSYLRRIRRSCREMERNCAFDSVKSDRTMYSVAEIYC